MIWIMEHR